MERINLKFDPIRVPILPCGNCRRRFQKCRAEEIAGIKGVGKAISGKIGELLENGKMETLEKYKAITPSGIQEMLNIKGFGPKKIMVIWKELEVVDHWRITLCRK